MENMKLELIGRDYFDPQAAILLKQYKLELWPGYVTSIRQVPPCLLICSALIVRTLGRWPLSAVALYRLGAIPYGSSLPAVSEMIPQSTIFLGPLQPLGRE